MNIQTKTILAVAYLLTTSLLAIDPACAAEGAGEEERAVWKAAAAAMSQEATRTRPSKTLYFKSDFGEASLMVSFAKDAIGSFCGLTGQAVSAMSAELKAVNAQPIAFDETLVESTGLKLTSKKDSRRLYLALSRVVFDPARERAWLAVDLNKVAGAVVRMDKVDGQWTKAAECGGWRTM